MARVGGLRQLCIAGGRLGGTHEAGKMIDIGKTVGAGRVVGLGSGVAEIGDFIGLKAIGDAHFIEISVAGKRQEAGMLIFPAEAAGGGLAGGFAGWALAEQ